jgi:hypothetical protein
VRGAVRRFWTGTSMDSSTDGVMKRKSRGATFAGGLLQLKADEE